MFGFLKKQPKIDQRWAFGALTAFIIMLVVNGLAGSTTLLGGTRTGEVSDSFPNLFAPAGVTFSIWGVIYLLLALFFLRVFGVWQTKKPAVDNSVINQVLPLFMLSCALNVLWMFAWQFKVIWLSVIIMVGLLVTLIKIYEKLLRPGYGWVEYVLTRLPFSIYFGWITVATIANITTFLVSVGWNGDPLTKGTWMVAVLLVGAGIGVTAALRNRDAAYLAVFIWAYLGILVKHLAPEGHNGRYPTTIITLTILLAVFTTLTINLLPHLPRRSISNGKR